MYTETQNKNVCHFQMDIKVARRLFMTDFSFFGPYTLVSGVGLVGAYLWKHNLYTRYTTKLSKGTVDTAVATN